MLGLIALLIKASINAAWFSTLVLSPSLNDLRSLTKDKAFLPST